MTISRHQGPIAAWSLAALAAAAVALALRDSFLGMLFQWRSSSTFSYGFLILPISLFLLWRERGRLAAIRPEPGWLALGLMIPMGACWVLATLIEVNVVHHFAAVLLVVLTVWAVLGTPAVRVIWFPLAYLLLMVPFGEFLVPTLMQWTADFAVLAVTQSGVPAYQDGYVFSLPSGDFEVIKACSGIRFLMATVAAGTVFAWVAYTSWRKRLLFLLACLLVPVVGNLLRAYLVVMLVHLSDGRLAGAHVLYGTIFFGAILLAMFAVGARYADTPAEAAGPGNTPVTGGAGLGRVVPAAVIAVAIAVVVSITPARVGQRAALSASEGLPSLPEALLGYSLASTDPINWQPDVRGAADERLVRYGPVGADRPIDVFIAAYDPSSRAGELTDSRNGLFDPHVWRRVGGSSASGYREIVLRPAPGASVADGMSRVVWSWYVVNGGATNSRLGAKVLELKGFLAGERPGQYLVAISSSIDDDPDEARRGLRPFASALCAGSGLACPAPLAAP
ncbi:MAG: exosortase A [Gammaproteobacteria bacterium]